MTAVDGEVGRLDRILAEQAARPVAVDYLTRWATAPTAAERGRAAIAEVERLRGMVVALEAECAALTDALADPDVTHEFEPCCNGDGVMDTGYSHGAHASPFDAFCMAKDADGMQCLAIWKAPVHRTPARVRAELDVP